MTSGPSGLRPSQTAGDLVAGLGDALNDISVTLQDAMATPSANLGFDHVERLADLVEQETRQGARGVVIVQGTDTLEETAFALELMLEGRYCVCLTGAMRGSARRGGDIQQTDKTVPNLTGRNSFWPAYDERNAYPALEKVTLPA